jgi:hypothetical protein
MTIRTLYTAALTLCLLTAPLLALAESKVVARVGSVPITIFDLGRLQQILLPLNPNFHTAVPAETL